MNVVEDAPKPVAKRQKAVAQIVFSGGSVLLFENADLNMLKHLLPGTEGDGTLIGTLGHPRIFLCTHDTDMRKSFDSLRGIVRSAMHLKPSH